MKFIGLFLFLAGLVSLILGLTGANLFILNWLNQYGETASWAIRIGITLLGGILYYVNRNDD
ncbi:hypothetical protein [Pontibacter akesuensis]|uniref:DUF378 domain-containing protein n=1 Tax=Pontibacter akesuensis TaxID=388950 RepID=A0A1I7IFW9_9BACT|nr:hypothetical protein [Pontibacter akesuensis]GHA67005.1 hypothetical protein GCM10007389_20150 [Pontibacter akesuensis]SFU71853.1 hypothetical protein SAMN04487941_2186 [Pontibacter akesuensis]